MAACSDLRSRITEISTCPICREDFKDPRSLPCVHSFCLQCLEGYCKDKYPGDEVQCPLCRKEFEIPQDGLQTLPANFFLKNMIEAKNLEGKEPGSASCEACSTDQHVIPAEVYCVDCGQKLCERCSVPHQKWKGGPHDVRPLGEEISAGLVHHHGSFCDKHPDERLKLYCFDCRGNICVMCFAVYHQQHKCGEVENVAKDFMISIKSKIKPFPPRIFQFHEAVIQIEMANKRSLKTINEVECEVQERGNEIKRLVDDHVTKLMQELNEIRASSVKEAQTRRESFELALTALESFQAYASEIASKGSPCDITRAANDMLVRADELLKTHVISAAYRPPHIRFVSSNTDAMTARGKNNIVGSLKQLHSTSLMSFIYSAKNSHRVVAV